MHLKSSKHDENQASPRINQLSPADQTDEGVRRNVAHAEGN